MFYLFFLFGLVASYKIDNCDTTPPVDGPVCGENEIYTSNRIICPPQSCESIYTTYACEPVPPEPGCDCIEGYLRNSEGVCIPSDSCPVPGGCNGDPNATNVTCPNPCPVTCENPSRTTPCTKLCPTSGCQCNEDYILGPDGKCVKPENCPTGCGCNGDPNAIVKSCPDPCPPTCDNPVTGPCQDQCLRFGCECKEGYILSSPKGKCIPRKQCPGCNTGCNGDPNAEFTECTSLCPKTCDNPNDNCKAPCQPPGCKCKPGYVLSKKPNGKCIKLKECPVKICTGQNEEYTECTGCEGTCDNLMQICPAVCGPPGCQCKPGYVRSNGKCIRPQDCIEGCNGDPNATNVTCPNPCPVTCKNPTRTTPCTKLCPTSGCQCNEDYILGPDGKCVKPENCPTGCGCNGDPNAIVKSCPDPCPPTCDNPVTGPCQDQCLRFGCECKEGYILSSPKGKCIPRKQCPGCNTGCNGDPNAEFTECTSLCPKTCDNPNDNCKAPCQPPGCKCKPGYVLSKKPNGKCIKLKECPVKICIGQNEEYTECTGCEGTCNNLMQICPAVCGPPGCQCKPGYVRSNGKCIRPQDCIEGCNGDPNATNVTCPDPCPVTCENPMRTTPCTKMCLTSGCQCNDNYILGPDGKCVLPENCPACGCNGDPNAIVKSCPDPCPPTCDNPVTGPCLDKCYRYGCECKEGYILSSSPKGKCIPREDCYGCKGDPNATFKTCATACPPTCANPNPKVCPIKCVVNTCECNPGYLLHKGKCILPDECPDCNGDPNAVFTTCTSLCPKTCDNPNDNCKAPCQPPGCKCKPGYVLSKKPNGKCIKPEECPGCNCGPNSTYKTCATACPATCANPNPKICPLKCIPTCECNRGYLLHEGQCVLPKDCPEPPQTCGYNEIFTPNKIGCPPETCETLYQPPYPCPPPHLQPITPGCKCLPGYLRNSNGICIPKEQCPPPNDCKGDPNAVFTMCTSLCPKTCDNPNDNCKAPCQPPGCKCKPGYVLSKNPNGICIKPEECPGCNCGPNSTYKTCATACPATCANPNPKICPLKCIATCECNRGYLLHDGQCVLPKDCPGCNGDPNAEFTECTSLCPRSCDNFNLFCKAPCQPPGCQCKDGYVLSKGKCIKPEQCTSCNGDPNAEYTICTTLCPKTCENPTIECKAPCQPPGCQCKRGYVLSNGKCIRPEECPGCNCGPNSTYKTCATACPATCANPKPKICPLKCIATCECKPGYLLHKGQCVLPEDCPDCNGDPNAVFTTCTSLCPKTCDNPNDNCKAPCQPPGCKCKPGYVLSKKPNGKCIKPEECPGCNCGPNSTYKTCATACPATCANPNPKICPLKCIATCECNRGYLLHEGQCVLPEDCPDNCN